MGQATLAYGNVPLRNSATRRRLRTVVRHLITCAAKVVRHGRAVYLRYADTNPWGRVLRQLYADFAAP